MPRRDDIASILLIGSGPIVIGQACEFDYSGTQACRVLRDDGYRVVLVNSNPATIMTDPDFADATYVEPLRLDVLEAVIARERPDALLPTLGGQTALNLAMELVEAGVLEEYGVELIGADAEAIATAEDRGRFKEAMQEIGLSVPRSGIAHTMDEARRVIDGIGLPVVIRPAYILGGRGTGMAATIAASWLRGTVTSSRMTVGARRASALKAVRRALASCAASSSDPARRTSRAQCALAIFSISSAASAT